MRPIPCLLLVLLAASPSPAQTAPPEMRRLAFLVGEWDGEGWFRRPGGTETFRQTERIAFALDGAVLRIEGRGVDGDTEEVVHRALGIICYERSSGQFTMRAYRGDGQPVDAPVELDEAGLAWTMQVPGGTMRWEIAIDGDTWLETGTMFPEGADAGIAVMEMTLQRAPVHDQSSPRATVESWLAAVQAEDREAALSLGSAAWRERELSWERSFTSAIFERGLRLHRFTVHEPEINGDEASLSVSAVFLVQGEEDGEGLRFRLVRQEGSWSIVELR